MSESNPVSHSRLKLKLHDISRSVIILAMGKAKWKAKRRLAKPPPAYAAKQVSMLFQAARYLESSGNPVVSAPLIRNMFRIVRKTPMRLHPDVKRQVCRKCFSFLTPESSEIIVEKSVVCVTCWCGSVRRYRCDQKDWKLWHDRPENLVTEEEAQDEGEKKGEEDEGDPAVTIPPKSRESETIAL